MNLKILANPQNILARDLQDDKLEWRISFKSGHFAKISKGRSTHIFAIYNPTMEKTWRDATKRKPFFLCSTPEFDFESPSGCIRAIYKILKDNFSESYD